jgi:hypothetical protein
MIVSEGTLVITESSPLVLQIREQNLCGYFKVTQLCYEYFKLNYNENKKPYANKYKPLRLEFKINHKDDIDSSP